MSKVSAVSTCSSFICVTHLVKGPQFLNATVSAATAQNFLSPVTRIYASE